MKVLVLHNALGENPSIEDQDVLTQRDAVIASLRSLGHEASAFGCTLNLEAVRGAVTKDPPDVVFNLIESLAETDRLMPLVPLLLEALAIPYTGASSTAILATANKQRAKEHLRSFGLPTADWLTSDGTQSSAAIDTDSQWIIKPIWEHASVGMDDQSVVVPKDEADLLQQVRRREQACGRPMMAEQFIEGREFNLSLLAGDVLPWAEIDFRAFPPGKPRIVGHRAKWDVDSFEYQQTPRRFDFPKSDEGLLKTLAELARECWKCFELKGFARVDFRVDGNEQPWILEVNVNPCLSPDAGFAAAVRESGIGFDQAIKHILSEARKPSRKADSTM